jgi:uncharacterized C2H2 Zn-finger protein
LFVDPCWIQSGNEGPLPPYDWGCSSTTEPAGQSAQVEEESRLDYTFENHGSQPDHSGQDDSPAINALQCPECPMILATKKKHTAHLKTHTRPFKCNEGGCNASFALKKDCRRHVTENHSSVKWYCNFPGCTYKLAREGASRKDNVVRHVRDRHKAQDPRSYCLSI